MDAPTIRLQRTWDYNLIRQLDRQCLPDDEEMAEETYGDSSWWVAVCSSQVVAYAGLYTAVVGEAWLVRAGVLRSHRGAGLQRRLIRVRVQEAGRLDVPRVLTYTSAENIPSQRSLVSCRFKPYLSVDGVIYFERLLQRSGPVA